MTLPRSPTQFGGGLGWGRCLFPAPLAGEGQGGGASFVPPPLRGRVRVGVSRFSLPPCGGGSGWGVRFTRGGAGASERPPRRTGASRESPPGLTLSPHAKLGRGRRTRFVLLSHAPPPVSESPSSS